MRKEAGHKIGLRASTAIKLIIIGSHRKTILFFLCAGYLFFTAQQPKIRHERIIEPSKLPPGSKFRGYEGFVVQDIKIDLSNTRYLRARYQTPDEQYVIGEKDRAESRESL